MTDRFRLGLNTPIVVTLPGASGSWERDATPTDLIAIAQAADDLGYDYLTCSEHVAVPTASAPTRGATYWDPLATLSFLAASTTRIHLATSVVVLGYHHPLELVKRYGTLDLLSGGRLILGVGVGSLRDEFQLLGLEWDLRGPRADDAIRALRASFGRPQPEYQGSHVAFSGVEVNPCGPRRDVPIWVGGKSKRSLRRAVELGDGWMPFGLSPSTISTMLAGAEVPPGFEVALATPPLDPLGDPARTRTRIATLRAAGATAVTVTISATSASHYIDQLAELRSETTHHS